jgi:hypothetical protein
MSRYGRDTFEQSLIAGVKRFGGREPTTRDHERVAGSHEHDELIEHPRLMHVGAFRDLVQHF